MSATVSTIPASFYVSVTPSVIGAGALGLALTELMLDSGTRVPVGTVLAFPSAATVSAYFGATSTQATEANVYFNGYEGATQLPASLMFTQYPTASVAAYLRGGVVSGLSLTQLQALNGVLDVTINGTVETSSSITLAGATSFSGAAQLITTGLGVAGAVVANVTASLGASFTGTAGSPNTLMVASSVSGTISAGDTIAGTGVPVGTVIITQTAGTIGGAGTYSTSGTITSSSNTITDTSVTLYVTSVTSGTISQGNELVGSGVTTAYITTGGTGTGGTGTYVITSAQHVASEAMTLEVPVVTYDGIAGAFVVGSPTTGAASTIGYGSGSIAAGLALTQATGAVLSQGATAAVPGTFMSNITSITQNWATFQTLFDPDAGSGNAQKQLFAAWTNAQNNRYAYLATDTDITPTESTAATSSLGYILGSLDSSGTVINYQPVGGNNHLSAFVGGFIASINWNASNGRATAAYKAQTGIVPSVTSELVAANLVANGYNYYGSVATGGADWQFYSPGSITGPYKWIDSYVGQIWLNNQCQIALMNLLTTGQIGRVPYNTAGYGYIRQALTAGADQSSIATFRNGGNGAAPPSPVAAAVNNGVITPGVTLSGAQQVAVNTLAGADIVNQLQTQGWYLVIQPATAAVRAARTSPTVILIYTDGGAIQQINLSSVLVQ